jgi:hypothetical protein
MMEIEVCGTFWWPFSRRFVVRVGPDERYAGLMDGSAHGFRVSRDGNGLVESVGVGNADRWLAWLGIENYLISGGGELLFMVNRSFWRDVLEIDGRQLRLPYFSRYECPEIGFHFPLRSWIWSDSVRAVCNARSERERLIAIALTCLEWTRRRRFWSQGGG